MYPNDQSDLEPQQPPEESSNRTFLIVGGVLGGIVLLSVLCLAGVYFFSIMPSRNATAAQALAQSTQNAQVREALTATSMAASLATPTEAPTDTPVLAEVTSTASWFSPVARSSGGLEAPDSTWIPFTLARSTTRF